MNIKGFIENTLIDWPGKISSVIFLSGCNFKCPFCHNKDLVINSGSLNTISEQNIFKYLHEHQKWIDGVVITGGEPTLFPDLEILVSYIKSMGFLIKLDTNGTNPKIIESLVDKHLVDYISMDIKTALDEESYSKAAGTTVSFDSIILSIDYLLQGKVDYEFRTTLVPGLVGEKELQSIAAYIRSADKWIWQNFLPQNTLDENYMEMDPYNRIVVEAWVGKVKNTMSNIVCR